MFVFSALLGQIMLIQRSVF